MDFRAIVEWGVNPAPLIGGLPETAGEMQEEQQQSREQGREKRRKEKKEKIKE